MPKFKKNTSPAMYKKRSGFKMKGSPYPKNVDMKRFANIDISKLSPEDKKAYYAKAKELTGSDVIKHKGKEY